MTHVHKYGLFSTFYRMQLCPSVVYAVNDVHKVAYNCAVHVLFSFAARLEPIWFLCHLFSNLCVCVCLCIILFSFAAYRFQTSSQCLPTGRSGSCSCWAGRQCQMSVRLPQPEELSIIGILVTVEDCSSKQRTQTLDIVQCNRVVPIFALRASTSEIHSDSSWS